MKKWTRKPAISGSHLYVPGQKSSAHKGKRSSNIDWSQAGIQYEAQMGNQIALSQHGLSQSSLQGSYNEYLKRLQKVQTAGQYHQLWTNISHIAPTKPIPPSEVWRAMLAERITCLLGEEGPTTVGSLIDRYWEKYDMVEPLDTVNEIFSLTEQMGFLDGNRVRLPEDHPWA